MTELAGLRHQSYSYETERSSEGGISDFACFSAGDFAKEVDYLRGSRAAAV